MALPGKQLVAGVQHVRLSCQSAALMAPVKSRSEAVFIHFCAASLH